MNSTQRALRRSGRLTVAIAAASGAAAPVPARPKRGRPAGDDAPAPRRKAAAIKGPTRALEKGLWARGFERVAGVDEAGRGPLAGPVVAAAAILPADLSDLPFLNDSKQMHEAAREAAYEALCAHPDVAVSAAVVSPAEIDAINILQATLKAMTQAVAGLPGGAPDAALVDGNRLPQALPVKHAAAVVKGDTKSAAIAAASIVAKVTRDRLMVDAHVRWPAYGFDGHKGYPTAAHVAAIARHGPCPIHRMTFAPLKGRYGGGSGGGKK